MLEGLNEVAWELLSHAYGKANDVRGQLQALLSSEEETRLRALQRLNSSICHQGSRYSASAPAIPLLFELVADTRTKNRAGILDLILSLGLGDPDALLPEGIDPKTDLGDGTSSWSRLARKCYRVFAAQWQLLQTLAHDDDLGVRLLAVYALAWIPKQAQPSLSLMEELLVTETRSLVRADLLLAMGLLDRHTSQRIGAPAMEQELESDDAILRLAAAIALVTMPMEDKTRAFEVILSSLKLPKEMFVRSPSAPAEQQLPFGDLVEYASTTLRWMPAGNEARIVHSTIDALPAASAGQNGQFRTPVLGIHLSSILHFNRKSSYRAAPYWGLTYVVDKHCYWAAKLEKRAIHFKTV